MYIPIVIYIYAHRTQRLVAYAVGTPYDAVDTELRLALYYLL